MLSGEAALRAEPLWISGGKALGGLMCRGVSADSCFPTIKFASHSLGCNFQFRTKGSAGIRFGESYRHDVQVDVAHFSNAGLNNHNSGFNTYGVSYGFRF